MTFAIILGLLQEFWFPIISVVGALLWGWKQRRAGAAKERAKREAADRMVEDIADQIQNDVRAMSPEQVDAELRRRARK